VPGVGVGREEGGRPAELLHVSASLALEQDSAAVNRLWSRLVPVHSIATPTPTPMCVPAPIRSLYKTLFDSNVGLFSWWFSPAPLQGFEFESTFLLSAAMFTMAGALPVLPGPCQLLWWDHIKIQEGPIDM
jgi:hypothetical protein